MKKEFNLERKGYEFRFKNPKLDEYDRLVLNYKIVGIKENKHSEDGYYSNAEFNKNKKVITFCNVEIDGREIGGVNLPDEIFEELSIIEAELLKERKLLIEKVVDEVIKGEMLIDFSIVGCDYPHYQAWLKSLPKDLKRQEQRIMEIAIKRYSGERFISNSCDYLERKLKQGIDAADNLSPKAVNLRFDKKSQEYHGYIDTIVTSFQMKLSDLIDIEEINAKKEIARLEQEEIDAQRKSLTMEILKEGKMEGSDGVDYYSIVKLTDPLTGENLKFNCRNIFDVGYVVNPEYQIDKGFDGGIVINGNWANFESGKGWYPVRALTDFEQSCLKYLHKFPPTSKSVRL